MGDYHVGCIEYQHNIHKIYFLLVHSCLLLFDRGLVSFLKMFEIGAATFPTPATLIDLFATSFTLSMKVVPVAGTALGILPVMPAYNTMDFRYKIINLRSEEGFPSLG